jgi:uncharacterized protein (TIGR00255 family)
MKSMTGFGRGEANAAGKGVSFCVEILSVNRKQLDVRSNLPRELAGFEPLLKKLTSEKINRGAVSVSVKINYTSASASKISLNKYLAEDIIRKAANLQERFDIPGELTISDIINIPGILEDSAQNLEAPELEDAFSKAVNKALDALLSMRSDEGKLLKKDLMKRLKALRAILADIEPPAKEIPKRQKERLLQHLKDADISANPDDERILREVVIYCDKMDVSEEITRLKSHFIQFDDFLEDNKNPIGRSMDFLSQEINREITTLGNKAADTSVSPLVVKFKTELEKIREQVQNIE